MKNIINNFRSKNIPVPLLGRWNTDYCKIKINRKVDLANEDHCGVCSNYLDNKILENERKNLKKNINK